MSSALITLPSDDDQYGEWRLNGSAPQTGSNSRKTERLRRVARVLLTIVAGLLAFAAAPIGSASADGRPEAGVGTSMHTSGHVDAAAAIDLRVRTLTTRQLPANLSAQASVLLRSSGPRFNLNAQARQHGGTPRILSAGRRQAPVRRAREQQLVSIGSEEGSEQ